MASSFEGFPKDCVKYFQQLKKNNTKTWFDANRQRYDEQVIEPSRAFVTAMGKRLKKLAPQINADPRTNQSLFRIHRDTRFSKDKTPYKTNLALWFWEGAGKRMECSGFYFHLEPPKLMLGVGIYMFPKHLLEAYRKAVVDTKRGPALARALAKVEKAGDYWVGGEHYKRVPRGFDPDHKYAVLLRHNGLTAGVETPIPGALHTKKIVDHCFRVFSDLAPLHRWLRDMTEKS